MWENLLLKFRDYMLIHNYSSRTIKGYTDDTRQFIRFLNQRGIKAVSLLTKEEIKGYQNHLFYFKRNESGLTLSTQSKKIQAVKAFCKFLAQDNYLLYDPACCIESPKYVKKLPSNILNHNEVKKLLLAASALTLTGIRDRAILELLYSTGIRNTELRCLRLRDLDIRRGEIRIAFAKGGKSRIVPIGKAAAHFTELYLEKSRPFLVKGDEEEILFLSFRGKKLSKEDLSRIVKRCAIKANIRKRTGCHTLRHTCATHMLKGKADIRYIQELLGHKDIGTTQIYTKVELSDLKRVHSECHPRNSL